MDSLLSGEEDVCSQVRSKESVFSPTYTFFSERVARLVFQVVCKKKKKKSLWVAAMQTNKVSVLEDEMYLWARADGGQVRRTSK